MLTLSTLYVGTYAVSALLAVVLGSWSLRRAAVRSGRWFGALMLVLALWSLIGAAGFHTATPAVQSLLQHGWAVIGLSVVLLWVLFTAHYTRRSVRANPVVRLFVAAYGCLLALALTNPIHQLYYASLTLHQEPFSHVATTPGPARLLVVGYTIAGIALGTYYLVTLFQGARHRSRTPTVILASAVVLGFVPFGASELQQTPVPTYNHTIFGVSVFVLGVSYAVYRHSFYDFAPVARATLLDIIDDPLLVLDTERRLVDYNPAATTVAPALSAESIGLPVEQLQPTLAELLDDSASTRRVECTLPVGDEQRHFSVLVSDLSISAASEGAVLLLRDITERRDREQQLRETKADLQASNAHLESLNERLNDFASVVAHDLRNPLGIAMGYVDIAEETGEREHFSKINSAHDRMERLIDDLLTLARNETAVERAQTVALGAIAVDAWAFVDTPSASLTVTDDTPTIDGDPTRLRQLFENLFRNAVEHGSTSPDLQPHRDAIAHGSASVDSNARRDAGEHGDDTITVTVGPLAEATGFFVEDDGVGIPPAKRDAVLEHGVTSHAEGTGFGLTIVAQIATAHDWTVSVTAGTDGGARFEFAW